MANTVKLTIKVDDDGSLNVVAKEAKAAAAATDKLGTSTDKLSNKKNRFNKLEKGTAQLGANSTKGFAKQAQTIGGGLVPAYAVLAANIFALTAAFGFLKNAADVKILEQSQLAFARNTGAALGSITNRLREASDGMLGFQEAASASAIGLAKGFSPKQLEDLAKGARKASTALGRDFADSFDRLVRGASKAEPELLDELGITLRLEDATRRYAEAISLNRDELNDFQRSQAVLIETQRQLNTLFGDVEAASNPFVKLAKTLEDLVKTGAQYVLPLFEGIANLINRSGAAAVAVFGLLGLSILKAAIPMEGLTNKISEMEKQSSTSLAKAKQDLEEYRAAVKAAEADVQSRKITSIKSSSSELLNASKGDGSKLVQKVNQGVALSPAQKGQLKKVLADAEHSYRRHGEITKGVFKGVNIELVRDFNKSFTSMEVKSRTLGRAIKDTFVVGRLQATRFFGYLKTKGVGALKTVTKGLGLVGKAVGAAFKLAGFIGILTMLIEMFKTLKENFYDITISIVSFADKIKQVATPAINSLIEGFLSFSDSVIDVFRGIPHTIAVSLNDAARNILEGLDQIINSVVQKVNKFLTAVNEVSPKKFPMIEFISDMAAGYKGLDETKPVLSNLAKEFDYLSTASTTFADSYNRSSLGAFAKNMQDNAAHTNASAEALDRFNEAVAILKADLNEINDGLKLMPEGLDKVGSQAKAVTQLSVSSSLQALLATRKYSEGIGKLEPGQNELPTGTDPVNAGAPPKIVERALFSETDRAAAITTLKDALLSLDGVSSKYATTLQSIIAKDAFTQSDIETLIELETAGAAVNSGLQALREGLKTLKTSLRDSLGSGDIFVAIRELNSLKANADGVVGGIDTLGLGLKAQAEVLKKYNDALAGTGVTTEEFREKLIALQESQHKNAKDTLRASLAVGYQKENLTAQAKVQKSLNDLALKDAEILVQSEGPEKERLKRERELLEIRLEIAKVTKQVAAANELSRRSGSSLGDAITDIGSIPPHLQGEHLKNFQGLLGGVTDTFDNLHAQFKRLGENGELMAALTGGIANVTGSLNALLNLDSESALSQKLVGGMAVASAMLNSYAEVQKAASDARIRQIDNEIAAEKKRDGKSKESLGRLAAMEKKKDAEKKKAFEQNKKMQMAQTVIATATGAIQAYASAQVLGPFAGPIVGAMLAGLVVAMGAKQMGIIASSSYQGGGGGVGSAAGGSSVSLGDRNSTADLAKSRGARGELAYARGESGTGGMDSFKPAFSGYKNRAEGGNTGFVVGEQGPELFVPETPGRIVPNDDIAAGGVSNVSFNINTVDASGVEDLLVAQRGNIIGMIRQAANTYGQDFVEDVDTSTFTQSAGGVSRY